MCCESCFWDQGNHDIINVVITLAVAGAAPVLPVAAVISNHFDQYSSITEAQIEAA